MNQVPSRVVGLVVALRMGACLWLKVFFMCVECIANGIVLKETPSITKFVEICVFIHRLVGHLEFGYKLWWVITIFINTKCMCMFLQKHNPT